jgi:hypothetical protein
MRLGTVLVDSHPLVGDEPQHGCGVDEPGDAVGGEPVTGAQRLGPLATRDRFCHSDLPDRAATAVITRGIHKPPVT